MKKVLASLLVLSVVAGVWGLMAGAAEATSITIFNSKSEVQSQMEQMAAEYSKAKGVDVEVYYSNDTVAAHLSSRYAANNPYTLVMVDAKDIYSMAAEYALDMTDQEWVKQTKYAIGLGDKIYGFPVCIEARGVIYNADAIKKNTGKDFNPDDYATLDAFKALIEELKNGDMVTPTGIMKEDWSLAGHFIAEVYEQRPDMDAFVNDLCAGKVDLIKDAKFNALLDTFDVLKENNYASDSAIAAEREVTEQMLAEGEIAFMFGGNWDWSVINAYDYSENMGVMPIPQNFDDDANTKLMGGGSKFFYIDKSAKTTPEQQQAAKDFLNWLVFDAEGNKFLTEKCALVPAYSNITAVGLDPLGASVKKYADAGSLMGGYDYLPDDHYAKVGASMQKYLVDFIDRATLAKEIEEYWKTATVIPH